MAKKKVCSSCGYFSDEKNCPLCNSNKFDDGYKTLVLIVNPKESYIAKKVKIEQKGIFGVK